jgi:Domain of unknown function (DUF4917)
MCLLPITISCSIGSQCQILPIFANRTALEHRWTIRMKNISYFENTPEEIRACSSFMVLCICMSLMERFREHCWERTQTRLTQLIREGLESGQYPLFVAEGIASKKRQQIQQSGYLSYCLGKLERIENALVIYGLSLAEADHHIADTIADNPKLKSLSIGLFDEYGSPNSSAIRSAADRMVRRRNGWRRRSGHYAQLDVKFFGSRTAPVWGRQ